MADQGILIIDKPKDYTSHDVVARTRRTLNIKKVGHAGTLDPNATGVLVVLVGKATKLSQKLIIDDKEYLAVLYLGEKTDTSDVQGEVVAKSDIIPDEETIIKTIKSFEGEIDQVPPMHSAKKINGKKLYKLARQGVEVKRDPVKITIKNIEILKVDFPIVEIKVLCSKGTYIRQLADDIGDTLGCHAYLKDLRRTASGPFHIDEAITIDELLNSGADKIFEIAGKNEGKYINADI